MSFMPLFLLVIVVTSAFALIGDSHVTPTTDENVKYKGNVCVTHTLADGTVAMKECDHNILTDAGAEAIVNFIANGGGASFTNIGLCNATAGCNSASATSTTLDNEYSSSGLARSAGTTANPAGTGNLSIYNTFTASADGLTTNKTGLFNATTGDTLLAENIFSLVTLNTNDQLTINWTIQVS